MSVPDNVQLFQHDWFLRSPHDNSSRESISSLASDVKLRSWASDATRLDKLAALVDEAATIVIRPLHTQRAVPFYEGCAGVGALRPARSGRASRCRDCQ